MSTSNMPNVNGPHTAGMPTHSREAHDAVTPHVPSYFEQLREAGAELHGTLTPTHTPLTNFVPGNPDYSLPDSGTPYGAPPDAQQSEELAAAAPARSRRSKKG